MVRSPDVSKRRDAVRNRALLLASADRLFTERGVDVTLKDVAREAKVGVGTVYRHFPVKEDLVNAVFADRLRRWADVARAAAEEADGWRGLVRFLEHSLLMQIDSRALRDLIGAANISTALVDESRDAIAPLVRRMVARAQEQGALRSDFDATDATFIQVALAGVMDVTSNVSRDLYLRYLALFLDGMRARQGEALELLRVGPLDSEQTHQAMHGLPARKVR